MLRGRWVAGLAGLALEFGWELLDLMAGRPALAVAARIWQEALDLMEVATDLVDMLLDWAKWLLDNHIGCSLLKI